MSVEDGDGLDAIKSCQKTEGVKGFYCPDGVIGDFTFSEFVNTT